VSTVVLPGQRTGARRQLPRPSLLSGRRKPPPINGGRLGPWALASAFGAVYALDSVGRYEQFGTMSWDLAMFTEAVKQYAHLHAPIVDAKAPGFDLLGDHWHPILALIGPFFALWPSPATLLLAQAVLFAASILPVTRLARARLGNRAGYVLGAAYGASFGVVQAVDFDFHELAFAAPLIAVALAALLEERPRLLVLACVGLLCTKEELGVTVVLPLGVAWAWSSRPNWRRGMALAGLGLLGSALEVAWLIPQLNPDHVYGYLAGTGTPGSEGDVEGISQLLTGLGMKIHLLFMLGLVTGFTALFSPLVLLALPELLMRFASSNSAYWGTFFHYNSVLMPILFIAAIDGIARCRERAAARGTAQRVRSWHRLVARFGVVAVAAATLWLLPDFALGRLFEGQSDATAPAHVAALSAAVAEVPAGATVEASLDVLAPLAATADVFWIGNATTDPAPQYVVFDVQSMSYPATPDQVASFVEDWHPLTAYTVVSSQDGVDVLRWLG
jgi:uncharacterized membrane protein